MFQNEKKRIEKEMEKINQKKTIRGKTKEKKRNEKKMKRIRQKRIERKKLI